MTNDEKIIRRVFGRKDSPSSCKAQGLCWEAIDPQHTKCVPCSKDSWSRAVGDEGSQCESVYETSGADAFNMCNSAYSSCGGDSDCLALVIKYEEALKDGYSKDFVAFKKKVRNLGLLNTGLDFLNNLLNKPQGGTGGGAGGGGDDDDKGLSMGAKIGIGVGVLALLGVGAYFIFRNKD